MYGLISETVSGLHQPRAFYDAVEDCAPVSTVPGEV